MVPTFMIHTLKSIGYTFAKFIVPILSSITKMNTQFKKLFIFKDWKKFIYGKLERGFITHKYPLEKKITKTCINSNFHLFEGFNKNKFKRIVALDDKGIKFFV